VGTIIQPTLVILSSILILLGVFTTFLLIQPVIAISMSLAFACIYVALVVIGKQRIFKNSKVIAFQQGRVARIIQEGLGGIRDILIDGTQSAYAKAYRDALNPMQAAHASNQVIGVIPRFGLEAIGIVLIAGLAYMLAVGAGVAIGEANTIPILGALALGAQRLLPVLQQIYSAYINIKGNKDSTEDALNLLEQPMPNFAHILPVKRMAFQTAITLKDIRFRYTPQEPLVLNNINLEIEKGGRIGFIGTTGSGKSTLLDIIMGLLKPTSGSLLIDGEILTMEKSRAWQMNLAHVPQNIFLADSTIAENIAFGVPPEKIDFQRVKRAAEKAQIAVTIDGWRNQYNTKVGERGIRISGGQRQRIGIARALYKQANVIIFDEATSALDNETESAVIHAMEALGFDVTILMVAHRLSTLSKCDKIYELVNGRIR
jgi:ATP-binding cassette subfamily B protein